MVRKYNARLGLVFFSLYLTLYAGFVVLNTFWPETMEWTPAYGVNLAIWYGFGLMIAALLLALVYGAMCRVHPEGCETRVGQSPQKLAAQRNGDIGTRTGGPRREAGK